MTVALVIVSPWSEKDSINAELIARGYGPCLSAPMIGSRRAEEGESPTHIACHWYVAEHEDSLETIKELRSTLFANSNILTRGKAEEIPDGLDILDDNPYDPAGTFGAVVGDNIIVSHKEFNPGQWGWRAEMAVASGAFDPGVRAIAIYSDTDHTQYEYTTGAFVWDAGISRWVTEWNEGNGSKTDIHFAVLFASVQESRGTLSAANDDAVAYMRYGLPKEAPATIPDWQPWTGLNEDLYQIGDEVMHNGQHWVATVGNNHWAPGVFGWELVV